MAFVPVPLTIEARLHFALGTAEEAINVLHFLKDEDFLVTAAVAQEIADAISQTWDSDLKSQMAAETVFTHIDIKDISAADLPVHVIPVQIEGTGVTRAMPYSTALVATLRTLNGSRGGRGRVFFGGWDEAANSGGDLADAGVPNTLVGFLTDLQVIELASSAPPTSIFLGVTSRQAHAGGDPEGAPVAPVTRAVATITSNRSWDTQRRRSKSVRG